MNIHFINLYCIKALLIVKKYIYVVTTKLIAYPFTKLYVHYIAICN